MINMKKSFLNYITMAYNKMNKKHVVAQVGSAHPSGGNVKINLQLKKSYFSTSHELQPQSFLEPIRSHTWL